MRPSPTNALPEAERLTYPDELLLSESADSIIAKRRRLGAYPGGDLARSLELTYRDGGLLTFTALFNPKTFNPAPASLGLDL